MKKVKKVFTGIVVFMMMVSSLFANTAVLAISANVPQNINISIDIAEIVLTGIDVSLGESEVTGSATVTERSNAKAGYTVSVESTNGWKLMGTGTDFAMYVFSYDAIGFIPTTGDLTPVIITDSVTKAKNINKVFEITALFPELTEADDYSDSLTFTIAAK